MRRLAALLCLIPLAWTAPAMAQTEIHHCIGANGGAVFTDQPCAALQATPVSNPVAPHGNLPTAGPPPTMCAASLGELRQSVINAFASRDANRLAGLMLWDGYGRGAAIANIRSLGELMKQPPLDLNAPDAPTNAPSTPAVAVSSADPFAAPEAPPDPPPANDQLVLHTGGNDGSGSPHELRFSVVSRAGCLWLRNVD